MGSPFIERSKHAELTAQVESHFNGTNTGTTPGTDYRMPPAAGGSADWNSTEMGFPSEGGVNYTPRNQAGHSLKQDPFSTADGVPSDQAFWKA